MHRADCGWDAGSAPAFQVIQLTLARRPLPRAARRTRCANAGLEDLGLDAARRLELELCQIRGCRFAPPLSAGYWRR